jgi:hypothetical protein
MMEEEEKEGERMAAAAVYLKSGKGLYSDPSPIQV